LCRGVDLHPSDSPAESSTAFLPASRKARTLARARPVRAVWRDIHTEAPAADFPRFPVHVRRGAGAVEGAASKISSHRPTRCRGIPKTRVPYRVPPSRRDLSSRPVSTCPAAFGSKGGSHLAGQLRTDILEGSTCMEDLPVPENEC